MVKEEDISHPGANPEVAGTVARPRGDAEPSADWELEQRAFHAANAAWSTEDYQQLVRDLWRAYCQMEDRANSTPAPPVLLDALQQVLRLEPRPFSLPADWSAQVEQCAECQRYRDHPIQGGICDTHRRPLWERERHERHEEAALGWRAKAIAREALDAVTRGATAPEGAGQLRDEQNPTPRSAADLARKEGK